MTLGSLFDGSGTCPLAATLCGITPVWASEIEPFPVAVTTKRFPNMKHLGDLTKIKRWCKRLLLPLPPASLPSSRRILPNAHSIVYW